ncbi:unnamed protein product [Bemisia tabaci]|uniref:Uncharacterized protein n=1 Tax=Bemisia tabaci TaxID=7038 RepID=A0A9P0ANJ2_BEMTA|nr:unnamed protein product [Bemisia tabaci]
MTEESTKIFCIHCLLFIPKGKAGEIAIGSWTSSTEETIKGFVLLPASVVAEDTEVLKLFTRNDIEILTSHNCTPLQQAIILKEVDTLALIIESESSKNVFNSEVTPFFPVSVSGEDYDYERVQLLFGRDAAVYRGTKPSPNSSTIVDESNEGTMEKVLSTSTDLGFRSSTGDVNLIHFAARIGDNLLTHLLLKYGVSIETCDLSKYTPLLLACLEGHVATVSYLLGEGANVNAQTNSGETGLILACEANNLELAKLLLNRGADVNLRNNNGFVPLHFAIYNSEIKVDPSEPSIVEDNGNGTANFSSNTDDFRMDTSLILELLDRGAFVNASASYCHTEGLTPLVLAVELMDLKMIRCLLERGADVNIPCYGDQSVLKLAVDFCLAASGASQSKDVIAEIMKHNPDLNSKANQQAFSKVVLREDDTSIKIAQLFSQNGFNVDRNCDFTIELLHKAVGKNYINVVKKLLESGVSANSVYLHSFPNPTWHDFVCVKATPLIIAIDNHHHDILQLLVDSGADLTFTDKDLGSLTSPMCAARKAKNWTAAKILLQKKMSSDEADINRDNLEALMRIDDDEMMKEAIQRWVERGLAGMFSEYIPLSAKCGSIKMLEKLIEFGPCIDSRNLKGMTALHCVSDSNGEEVVRLLIKYGADIEARCFKGLTPLAHAVRRGDLNVVMELLKYEARIDSFDKYGYSPLYYAVLQDNIRIFEALLEYAFTNFQLICSTGILKFLRFSDISQLKQSGDNNVLYHYDNVRVKLQNLTKMLLCFLMKMKAAFPDEENLVKFVAWTSPCLSEPSLLLLEAENLSKFKYDIGYNPVDVVDLTEKLDQEINQLKMRIIDYTSVSLYDILTKDETQLSHYARNQILVESFISEDLESKFPSYAHVISCRMKRGMFRRMLLDQSIKLCPLLFKEFDILPSDMKEQVLSHLMNKDLEVLINACSSIAASQERGEDPAAS